MHSYNPDKTPDPQQWLALGEERRMQLAEKYHRTTRLKVPNVRMHAVFHAMVENQIAEGVQAVVHAMERLSKQGLSRHDSIHAVGWVLAQHLYDMTTRENPESAEETNARYAAAVDKIDAKTWREQAGPE